MKLLQRGVALALLTTFTLACPSLTYRMPNLIFAV